MIRFDDAMPHRQQLCRTEIHVLEIQSFNVFIVALQQFVDLFKSHLILIDRHEVLDLCEQIIHIGGTNLLVVCHDAELMGDGLAARKQRDTYERVVVGKAKF